MPPDFLQPLIDPTAPLPASWPAGFWGAFLLFLVPIGGGIPLGVLMARDAIPAMFSPYVEAIVSPSLLPLVMPVVTPLVMAAMYLVSDIVMAITHEPMFILLGWLAGIVPVLGKIRDFMVKSTSRVGLRDGGKRGPLGLILFSFTVDPVSARGAAAAAGHGFFVGWTLAIIGDMVYFAVLMTATLWLSGIFGDDRITVGATLIVVWGLSWLIRRRHQSSPAPEPIIRRRASRPAPSTFQPALVPVSAGEATDTIPRPLPNRAPVAPPRSKKARRKQRH
jgi:hypothetical protein